MKLGLDYEMARPELNDHLLLRETMEQIIRADQVGFSGSACPEIVCGALSQRTERIRLGLGIIVLPYTTPSG